VSAMGQVDSSTPDTSIAKMKFQNLKGGDLISTSYYAPPSQPREIGPGARSRTCWGAIFGGTFLYLAIMATFGSLGAAIFAGVGSSEGIKIWMTILAIISLYFAGHVAGRLSGAADRNVGMWNGLITFGMCFASVLVLGIALATASPYVVGAAGPRTAALEPCGRCRAREMGTVYCSVPGLYCRCDWGITGNQSRYTCCRNADTPGKSRLSTTRNMAVACDRVAVHR